MSNDDATHEQMQRMGLAMRSQAAIVLEIGGPLALGALVEHGMTMLTRMRPSTPGASLSPGLERLREAAAAARAAYELALRSGIVIPSPSVPAEGGSK